ncbi:HD domain-containing protein [Clostridium acidisoli DSM 12555]|uniref:HD domain-containing protein n=1 Tax=Clostridium acidisoli DSM 12555 TaxID=1121291 RepID=A0A1W1XTQ2_9CLOT|nr:HD domain-containing protein [Clostridium acidisoli]SMC27349.1 HD domain-containing protein [Clostridium acidisoli DSM 12555]
MIKNIMSDMIEYFGGDVRRINHAIKVYGFAKTLGELEGLDNNSQFILEVSAILHDIGIKVSEEKYNSSAGKYQEMEGPAVAKSILQKYKITDESMGRILHLIGNHHSYAKIDGKEFQMLIEADFIVNVFEDNINREAIISIRNKYFKTISGIKFINKMYL